MPGVMVHLSPPLDPPILKGMKIHPDDPFRFEFILNKGDSELSNDQLKDESAKLIKYFLASLTIPEKDLWVNLSPYEKNRIVPNSFGLTEMGRDLLAEDYMLKQITASLIYPEDQIGKKFWKRVYEEAAKRYGTTNIPVNTFNKVWIVPQKAVVYENAQAGTAYVVESRLKVMLEQDYLSLEKHEALNDSAQSKETNQLGSDIAREVIIPELTQEVNENKNFATLRQVYSSLILAAWYKKKIRDSILAQVYEDKNKVAGVSIDDPQEKEKIYQRYLMAFKKGAYNYIKEEVDPITQELTPRKYFSGGIDCVNFAMTTLSIKRKIVMPVDDDNVRGKLWVVDSGLKQFNSSPLRGLQDIVNFFTSNKGASVRDDLSILQDIHPLRHKDDRGTTYSKSAVYNEVRILKYLGLLIQNPGHLRTYRLLPVSGSQEGFYQELLSFLQTLTPKKMAELDPKFDKNIFPESNVVLLDMYNLSKVQLEAIKRVVDDHISKYRRHLIIPIAMPKTQKVIQKIGTNLKKIGVTIAATAILIFMVAKYSEYRAHRLEVEKAKRSLVVGTPSAAALNILFQDQDARPYAQKRFFEYLLKDVKESKVIQFLDGLKTKTSIKEIAPRKIVDLLKEKKIQQDTVVKLNDVQQGLNKLQEKIIELAKISVIFPVDGGKFTKGEFYPISRNTGKPHGASDIMATEGSIIRSVMNGTIVRIDTKRGSHIDEDTGRPVGYGLRVTVVGRIPGLKGRYRVTSTHMEDIFVKKGQEVMAGYPVGSVGTTGNAAGGPSHDHFVLEKLIDGRFIAVNPDKLLGKLASRHSELITFYDQREQLNAQIIALNKEIVSSNERMLAEVKSLDGNDNRLQASKLDSVHTGKSGMDPRLAAILFNKINVSSGMTKIDLNAAAVKVGNGAYEGAYVKTISDKAMGTPKKYGGIDFTANKIPLEFKNAGEAIKFHIDPAMLAQLQNSMGFVPVIFSVKPMINLRQFLGVDNNIPTSR